MRRFTLSVLGFAAALVLSSNTLANPVDEMLADLRARADVEIETQGGWTVATAGDGLTIWSFTPANHPAHPAYVERRLSERDGAWHIQMNVKCGADKAACDKLVADFRELNEQLRGSMESKGSPDGR